jgi:hypothetical protein
MFNTKIVSSASESPVFSGETPGASFGQGQEYIWWGKSTQPKLYFNNEHYFTFRSQRNGEQDLCELAANGSGHGSFVFIPEASTWLSLSTPSIMDGRTQFSDHMDLVEKELFSLRSVSKEDRLLRHYTCLSRQFMYSQICSTYEDDLINAGFSEHCMQRILDAYTLSWQLLPWVLDMMIAMALFNSYPEKTIEFVRIAKQGKITMHTLRIPPEEKFQNMISFLTEIQEEPCIFPEGKDISLVKKELFLLSRDVETLLESKIAVLNQFFSGYYEFSYEPFPVPLLSGYRVH